MMKFIASLLILLVVEVKSRPQTKLRILDTKDNTYGNLQETTVIYDFVEAETSNILLATQPKFTPTLKAETTTARQTYPAKTTPSVTKTTPINLKETLTTRKTFLSSFFNQAKHLLSQIIDSSTPVENEKSKTSKVTIEKPITPSTLDIKEQTTPYEYSVTTSDLTIPVNFNTTKSSPLLDTEELTTPFDISLLTTIILSLQLETTTDIYGDLTDSIPEKPLQSLSNGNSNTFKLAEDNSTNIKDINSLTRTKYLEFLTPNNDDEALPIGDKSISPLTNRVKDILPLHGDITLNQNYKDIFSFGTDEDISFLINNEEIDNLGIDEDTKLQINNNDIGTIAVDEDIIAHINNKIFDALALDKDINMPINVKDIESLSEDRKNFSLTNNKEEESFASFKDILSLIKNKDVLAIEDKGVDILVTDKGTIDIGPSTINKDTTSQIKQEISSLPKDEYKFTLLKKTDNSLFTVDEEINALNKNITTDENESKESINEPNILTELTEQKTTSLTNTLTDYKEDLKYNVSDVAVKALDNIINDIVDPVEELVPIELKITVQPGDRAVFREGSVLGLSCDAHSPVDNKIEFSWTLNGRFVEINSGHSFRESSHNGNIIIYNMGQDDEGLYQCVASNSEGVVFSRVIKVKMRNSVVSKSSAREKAARSIGEKDKVTVVLPYGQLEHNTKAGGHVQVVMAQSS